jgi:NAD+ kinase
LARCDLAVVIGGDGTMLNIARTLAPFEVRWWSEPEQLGFLTDISVDNMIATIGTVLTASS